MSEIIFPGMNNTANPATSVCTVEDICGFGGMSASHMFFESYSH